MARKIQALNLVKSIMMYQGEMLGLKLLNLPESDAMNELKELQEELQQPKAADAVRVNIPS